MWHPPLKPIIVAVLVILLPWVLHVVKKRWGAPARYYGLVLVSPLLVLGLWSLYARPSVFFYLYPFYLNGPSYEPSKLHRRLVLRRQSKKTVT
jgi:hypothetical protein